jgi:5-formyltetrahydrofolate cyclo-ligase
MGPQKAELRQKCKLSRLSLSPEERKNGSIKIQQRLQNIANWSEILTLHFFEPILSLGEVDVSGFIDWLQAEHPSTALFTSRQFDKVWQVTSLKEGNTQAPDFDVVIVPMLGFDESLQRIGYGGGYYDKFLASQLKAQKIGVCFEQCKLNHVPAEPHDVPLNVIVTEERIYR